LLRMRRQRPCDGRAADKSDELPSFHEKPHAPTPSGMLRLSQRGCFVRYSKIGRPTSELGQKQTWPSGVDDVRFTSESDIRGYGSNVCFGPIADTPSL
jgi:hypothetical protein